MTRDLNYGRLMANRYQIAELVGEGAMGRVYRAKDTLLGGVTVAVKFLSQTLLNNNMRDRFEREATISALLGEKSIHVVRVRDYGVDENNIPFYVMEFLSGESLSDMIRYQPLPISQFLTLTRHICLGLQSAHQGIPFNGELCRIIHRDIKPSNILVVQDPTVGQLAKILDFGIAKLVQPDSAQTQSFMGTLAYCSPEQMEGKELDHRSDIYSLGVMMYEMLTTDMPLFPQNSSFGGWYQAHHDFKPEAFNPILNVPGKLEDLVMSCLAKAREARPQSVAEIIKVLESLQKNNSHKETKPFNINSFETSGTYTSGDDLETQFKFEIENESNDLTLEAIPSTTEICLQTSWPDDKPVQKIVFPELLSSPLGSIPVICVMLDYQDILNRMSSTRYNQFLFMNYPHPLILWITLLYNQHEEPRWLPCYLDLKTSKGQEIVRTLAETGSYRILFFALNQPQQCQNVMTATINSQNCKMLKQWADASQLVRGSGKPLATKKLLKEELEKIKGKILFKMQSLQTGYASDISG